MSLGTLVKLVLPIYSENVYKLYGDKFTSHKHLNVDISVVDVFSLARHGKVPELKKIFEMGIDPNSKDKYGNTVLIIGC